MTTPQEDEAEANRNIAEARALVEIAEDRLERARSLMHKCWTQSACDFSGVLSEALDTLGRLKR